MVEEKHVPLGVINEFGRLVSLTKDQFKKAILVGVSISTENYGRGYNKKVFGGYIFCLKFKSVVAKQQKILLNMFK